MDDHARQIRTAGAFLTPLIGRDEELRSLHAAIIDAGHRIITLTGPGGVGKTRLISAAVDALRDEFGGRVWFVPIAPVQDVELVPATVAHAIGVTDRTGDSWLDACARALGSGRALLIVDNVEHVIDGAARVAELVRLIPGLTIVFTSREALRVRGEREFPVSPLSFPPDGADPSGNTPAVALFVERARSVRPDFELSRDTALAITEICRRLDGLPLAIELAAARTKVLAPQALLNRLSHRLHVLTGGPRDLPARQQTMRGALAWSYDLLGVEDRRLFQLISVFTGGAALDALEELWPEWSADLPDADLIDGLESLVAKSLMNTVEIENGLEGARYLLLETIREYGLEQLDSAERLEDARLLHSRWFANLVEHASRELGGPRHVAWIGRLDREQANVRSAVAWAIEQGDAELALRFVGSLWQYWDARGFLAEAAATAGRALAIPVEVAPGLRAAALYGSVVISFRRGDYATALAINEQMLDFCRATGDLENLAQALNGRGLIGYDTGDYEEAERALVESVAIRRRLGDVLSNSNSMLNLGILYLALERYDEAEAIYREVHDRNLRPDEAFERAYALNGFGLLAHQRGDFQRAIAMHEEAIAIRRGHDSGMMAASLANLGAVQIDANELAKAAASIKESLLVRWERGERRGIAESLALAASVAWKFGARESAARLLGAARELVEHGIRLPTAVEHATEKLTAEVIRAMGKPAFDDEFAAGRVLPLESIVSQALALEVRQVVAPARPQSIDSDVSLTPRELEVLGLLAEGRSDREIGDMLFISRATAARHVANIFLKLDINTRTAAAAYAFRRGLVRD